jgi:hypothetical protein
MNITGEEFNQPIFGANNIAGLVAPIPGMGLPATSRFKIKFNNGGVGTFLPVFLQRMGQCRQYAASMGAPSAGYAAAMAVGAADFHSAAYVDPSDPTTIYVCQPPAAVGGMGIGPPEPPLRY